MREFSVGSLTALSMLIVSHTYGQLLTVLTRFVEPKEGYIGSFNVLDHWAAHAAVTAASYGWIEDVPIDLNAPATYGAFVNLLIKIYDL